MGLLDSAGHKEGLFTIFFFIKPLDNLPDIFAVLVLFIAQPGGTIPRWCLSPRLCGEFLKMGFPVFPVGPQVDGTVLCLIDFPCGRYQGQFVILKHDLFVPGQFTGLVAG